MNKKLLTGLSLTLALSSSLFTFAACETDEQLEFILSDDGTYYICESGISIDSATEVTIPAEYKGKPVKEVSRFGGDNFESITISEGIEKIQKQGLSGNTKLKTLTLGNGLKEIEKIAFAGCVALESITLPDSVVTIGICLFERCESLKEVKLSKNLTSIPSNAFRECRALKTLVLPDKIETIGDFAFFESGLESITIGNQVNKIENDIFRGCTQLTSVTYKGTKESWKAIKKEQYWWIVETNEPFKPLNYTIHCTNGDLILDPMELYIECENQN